MTVDERARAGLFLAMQYPVEVPGVIGLQLPAHRRRPRSTARRPSCAPGSRRSTRAMDDLQMDPAFAERNVNEGFSGGEKKRHEILQLELLKPKIAILDETDSGLDVDALRDRLRGRQPGPRGRRGRHPADHPLHADPALHQARLRARLRRRPDRRGGRPGAGRPARGRGLRDATRDGREALIRRDRSTAASCFRRRGRSARTSRSSTRTVHDGKPLVYLDTAATSQKPQAVLDAMRDYYEQHNANVHRGVHTLGRGGHGAVRGRPRQGRGVHRRADRDEVVFTKNATEALNLVATRSAWAGAATASARATRSSSPRWSTTPTSCRGSCSAERTGADAALVRAHRRRPARPVRTSTS